MVLLMSCSRESKAALERERVTFVFVVSRPVANEPRFCGGVSIITAGGGGVGGNILLYSLKNIHTYLHTHNPIQDLV